MTKCYEYRTSIGKFYIVEQNDRYHAVYAGFCIGSCQRPEELSAVLGYGYRFNLFGTEFGEINTFNLGIPSDLSDWTNHNSLPVDLKDIQFNRTSSRNHQNQTFE